MEELQAILEAVDASVAAQDFSTMTDEQLAEAVTKISDYGSSLKKSDKPTKQEIEDVITLAGALEAVQGEVAKRDEANAELKAQFDAAAAKFGGEPESDPEEEPTPETIPPVTASRPSAAEVAKRRPVAAEPKVEPKAVALVAAAGEKQDSIGTRFENSQQLADAMLATWERSKDSNEHAVARIPIHNQYSLGEDGGSNYLMLNEVMRKAQDARNADVALTAALGCAPSEPVYEFFNQSSLGNGLVDLPSVSARRGSRTYPPVVAFPNIDGQTGIGTQYAGATKTCYTVACGTTRAVDVIANYVCLTFDNEEGLFYPEHVAHYQALAMVALEHEVNQRLIENMRDNAITTTVQDLDTGGGTVTGLLRAFARTREYYIQRHKMAESAVVDVVIPHWFLGSYSADIVTRQSSDWAGTVSFGMARLAADARQLGVNVQAVYDWQEPVAEGYDDFGSFLMFAPGTFVRMDGPTIDLGVVRDSTLNAANDFQVWLEVWNGLAAPGNQALYVQGVETCPLGQTALGSAVTCGAS